MPNDPLFGFMIHNAKTKETQPDYTGTVMLPAGLEAGEHNIAAWKRVSKKEKNYLSLKLSKELKSDEERPGPTQSQQPAQPSKSEEDLPF